MAAVAVGLRRVLAAFARTPLHPQWLVLRDQERLRRDAGRRLAGTVLDIGCAGRELQRWLAPSAHYIGLDHPLATAAGYGTSPHVYGDGQRLPIATGRIDGVALLDVLEHLPDPHLALREVARVLKPGGVLVVQVPFLYPLHDEPRDFTRFTLHGLERVLADSGFEVEARRIVGHPLETAALLWNIALAKSVLNLGRHGSPSRWLLLPPLSALAVVAVPLVNLAGWLLARLTPDDSLMPLTYQLSCIARGSSHRP